MLLVSGVTLLKLFEGVTAMEITGALLIPVSFLMVGWGLHRYVRTRALIEAANTD